eukprot:2394389-Amphidinium_carterae.1
MRYANVLYAVVLQLGLATPWRDVAVKRIAKCSGRWGSSSLWCIAVSAYHQSHVQQADANMGSGGFSMRLLRVLGRGSFSERLDRVEAEGLNVAARGLFPGEYLGSLRKGSVTAATT